MHAPNAALLIDFDNVTLGIRSDLTKELKQLLSSDIIKGKVAVSRAYADWRRYHQYIVPLSESSIDLIFAPAHGNNKKNATDIRLAIDAMELVFTRPEIGTFILLSGDSDFSMLVIKLKEYGKYVIGVGIRESASDLLIQNCDEYYSYSDLAGLTKETDLPSAQKDPWVLVREAVDQMAREGDVMRSDRLKQVMQQIDPNFDEKNAGYSRFSKFVMEAGHKGHIRITRMDNGQYEVAPLEPGSTTSATAAAPAAEAAPAERPEGRGRSRGRGRGRGRGGRGEPREAEAVAVPGEVDEAAAPPPPRRSTPREEGLTLARAFELVRRALGELPSPVSNEALRLRMSVLHGRQDPLLEPARFSQLLRQVHDAEIADVRKLGDDEFEILARGLDGPPVPSSVGSVGSPEGETPAVTADNGTARGGVRFRRGSRGASAPPAIAMVGVVSLDDEPAKPEAAPAAKPARGRKKAAKAADPAPAGEAEPPKKKRAARPRAKKKAE